MPNKVVHVEPCPLSTTGHSSFIRAFNALFAIATMRKNPSKADGNSMVRATEALFLSQVCDCGAISKK